MHIKSIYVLVVLSLFLSVQVFTRADTTTKPTSRPTTAPVKVKWEDAARHAGEMVKITGPVMGTHVTNNKKALLLNIGKDFPDPTRFTILIAVSEKHPANEADYKDKDVTVVGKIELYKNLPQIRAAKAEDVKIEKWPSTRPVKRI